MGDSSAAAAVNRYDEVAYDNRAYHVSHVRNLEALATLFGMRPAPIPTARVLELGCAVGRNLLPQAQALPRAQFVGVDSSAKQIATGHAALAQLGLKNVELRHANLLDIDASWGKFDYIICHGVYSWVPPEVQTRILEICRANLAPQGVALVTYNVFPGWRQRGMIREMLHYHAGHLLQASDQISQAKSMLHFLHDHVQGDNALAKAIQHEMKTLGETSDAYLFHELLEDHNHPVYFHEFAASLQRAELQFMCEANFSYSLRSNLPASIAEPLADLPVVMQEQYMDFVRNRMFRESLVCQAEVPLGRQMTFRQIEPFFVSFRHAPPSFAPDLTSDQPEKLELGKQALNGNSAMSKAVLLELVESWPEPRSIDQLHGAALARLAERQQVDATDPRLSRETLMQGLMAGFCCGALEIFVHPPKLTRHIAAQPTVAPLARFQAAQGETIVSNRHENLAVPPLTRYLLRRLDGAHDRQALIQSVQQAVDSGEMILHKDQQRLPRLDAPLAAHLVDQALAQASSWGLLVP